MKNYSIILTIFFIFCGPSVDCEYENSLAESEVRDLISKTVSNPYDKKDMANNLVIVRELIVTLENHKTFLGNNEECVNLSDWKIDNAFSKPSYIFDMLIAAKAAEVQLIASINK